MTAEQTTENQVLLVEKAGDAVIPDRVFAETIGGTVPAMKRPVFVQLVNKLKRGYVLVVAKDAPLKYAEKYDMTLEAVQQEIRDKLVNGAAGRGLASKYGVSAPIILKLFDKAAAYLA